MGVNTVRLQKVIADAGVASRRKAEELIRQGRVTVNGTVAMEMGLKVDPAHDHVKVDGCHLKPAAPKAYVMLNKPKGVLTTLEGPGTDDRPRCSPCFGGSSTGCFRSAVWITIPRACWCSPMMENWPSGCCILGTMFPKPIW